MSSLWAIIYFPRRSTKKYNVYLKIKTNYTLDLLMPSIFLGHQNILYEVDHFLPSVNTLLLPTFNARVSILSYFFIYTLNSYNWILL